MLMTASDARGVLPLAVEVIPKASGLFKAGVGQRHPQLPVCMLGISCALAAAAIYVYVYTAAIYVYVYTACRTGLGSVQLGKPSALEVWPDYRQQARGLHRCRLQSLLAWRSACPPSMTWSGSARIPPVLPTGLSPVSDCKSTMDKGEQNNTLEQQNFCSRFTLQEAAISRSKAKESCMQRVRGCIDWACAGMEHEQVSTVPDACCMQRHT